MTQAVAPRSPAEPRPRLARSTAGPGGAALRPFDIAAGRCAVCHQSHQRRPLRWTLVLLLLVALALVLSVTIGTHLLGLPPSAALMAAALSVSGAGFVLLTMAADD